MRIIDRFSIEHDVFITQLEVIETLCARGAEIASIAAAMRTLAAPLLAHAENEERVLFPCLGPSMDGPVSIMVEEHQTLHEYLDQLLAEPTRWELEEALEAFLRVLRGHIAKEEQAFFPAAADILGDAELEKLDRELRGARSPV